MSTTIQRDRQPKGTGKAPAFQIRIPSELKEQMNDAAAEAGMSLGNWLKELARKELRKHGVEPKA